MADPLSRSGYRSGKRMIEEDGVAKMSNKRPPRRAMADTAVRNALSEEDREKQKAMAQAVRGRFD